MPNRIRPEAHRLRRSRQLISGVVALACLAFVIPNALGSPLDAAGTSPSAATQAPVRSLTFTPTDDAYVTPNAPGTNFGAASALRVDGDPVEQSLLKFSISGIGQGRVVAAKLRLFCVDTSSFGGDFHRVSDSSWSEETVTWENAPAEDQWRRLHIEGRPGGPRSTADRGRGGFRQHAPLDPCGSHSSRGGPQRCAARLAAVHGQHRSNRVRHLSKRSRSCDRRPDHQLSGRDRRSLPDIRVP